MKACLLTYEADAHVLPRIQLLGHSVRAESPDRIESLGPNTTDTVYLIPWELMSFDTWSEHRVLLARASRYYLVYGQDLSTEQIMNAARDGAYDVLDEADGDERWNAAMQSAARSQALWWQLYGGLGSSQEEKLVGHSKPMQGLRESIQRIGATDAKVLITGESGTGKELVAECLHEVQGRGKFVAVNCAAIPAELLESELFGVKRGAYTGANTDKPGLVEEAAGGTLFLDEIGEMDITLQPKLLRFLETHVARRVGSTKEYRCDVRVVSATNRDLRADAEAGSFRLDLYYRISEVILTAPPLRHRVEDIAELVRVFLDAAAIRLGKNFETIEP
ncbi:MAG: sigma-54 factor interaction domain-containing protein, partial [Verrucomicrobiota bacterium]